MKKKFLSFWKRNYIFIILSLVHPIAIATSQYWGKTIIQRNALGPLTLSGLYGVFLSPILHFIYGCIAYKITKNIVIPNIILIIIYFICFCFLDLVYHESLLNVLLGFAFYVGFPTAFSLIGAFVTWFIYSWRNMNGKTQK